jgi:hypothetical protein
MGNRSNPNAKDLTLVPGRFYTSVIGQIWCCYNTDKDAASCVRVDDDYPSKFSIDGKDLRTGEMILIAAIGEDHQAIIEQLNRQVVSDSIRIKYFRKTLEAISDDRNPDRMALLAYGVLMLLASEND